MDSVEVHSSFSENVAKWGLILYSSGQEINVEH